MSGRRRAAADDRPTLEFSGRDGGRDRSAGSRSSRDGGREASARGSGSRSRRREEPGFLGRSLRALARRPVSVLAATSGTVMVVMISMNALSMQSGPHPAPLFSPPPALDRFVGAGGDPLVRDVQQALADLGYYSGPVDGVDSDATAAAVSDFEVASGVFPTGTASEAVLARALTASPRSGGSSESLPAGSASSTGTTGAATGSGNAAVHVPPAAPAKRVATTTYVAGMPKPQAAAPATEAAPEASEEVRRVQKALADLGYGPLTIDGLAGGKTTTAVRRFRLDHGLPVSGDIDGQLVETLVRIGGLPAG